jgi:tetratricopeptide (TPR) repeat protein
MNELQRAAERIRDRGLVLLAGAGVSMDAPASLPGWQALNDMITDALCQRVTRYFQRKDEWLEPIRESVRIRRDTFGTFSPDYQAQVIEEQCGETYFRALQALDSSQRAYGHGAIAALAQSGHLKAIVTTNFDRLIEQALDAAGVAHNVYCDARGYGQALDALEAPGALLPVIKIHGTVSEPRSMVDTLKQRLLGRGPALDAVLGRLLRAHYWLYAGFSAADLSHDPHYLGLIDAAGESPGFTFTVFPSAALTDGAQALKQAYGERGVFVEATLRDAFTALLEALNIAAPVEAPVVDDQPRTRVLARVTAWADALQPFEAVNITAALFEAAGEEHAAWTLLHKTWGWRHAPDCVGPHYARYQYNYARLCTAAGELEYEETVQNFYRSQDAMPESEAQLAYYFLLSGRHDWFMAHIQKALERTVKHAEYYADATLVFMRYCEIYGQWETGLKAAYAVMDKTLREAGDQPRYARIAALGALIAARGGLYEMAAELANAAAAIAARLGEETILGEAHHAQGVAAMYQEHLDLAFEHFTQAQELFTRNHRWPLSVSLRIDIARAAAYLMLWEQSSRVFEDVNKDIDRFPVYLPRYSIALAEAYLQAQQFDAARQNLLLAVEYAQTLENAAAERDASRALQQLDSPNGHDNGSDSSV